VTYSINPLVCEPGVVTHLSIIPRNATVQGRIGRACRLLHFEMSGYVDVGGLTNLFFPRLYLVWDAQPNKSLANIADIFIAGTPLSLQTSENLQRFTVLHQENFGYYYTGGAGAAAEISKLQIDWSIPLPDLCCYYTTSDDTGVIGNCISGALLLVTRDIMSSFTSGEIVANTRVWFRDD